MITHFLLVLNVSTYISTSQMFGYNTNNQCFIILLRSGLFVGCFAGFISL